MKKILKITLVCLSLVSVLLLSSFSAFAYDTQENYASYGSIHYTELTSGGSEVADLVLPIIVNDKLPYYSRYTNSANKTWQSLNYSGRYALIRNILPAMGMNGYVSKASNVSFDLDVAYRSYYFNNNYYNSALFEIDYEPYGWTPVEAIITTYIYNETSDTILSQNTSTFYGDLKFTYDDLGITRDDIASDIWYCFSLSVTFDPSDNASDFVIKLPDSYDYFPFDTSGAYNDGYDDGYEVGKEDGYVEGSNTLSLGWLGDVIGSVLSIEIIPDVSLGVMLFFVFGLSIVGVIAKLIAGG